VKKETEADIPPTFLQAGGPAKDIAQNSQSQGSLFIILELFRFL